MNPTTPDTPDELDLLFSEFFKAQLKEPWPKAPVPTAEPSELAAPPSTLAPANAPAARDASARARFTLAASVALVIGASWFLSNGFQGTRGGNAPAPNGGPGMLQESGADGKNDPRLKVIENDKMKQNNGNHPPIKVGLD
jgi:hypothetical protein